MYVWREWGKARHHELKFFLKKIPVFRIDELWILFTKVVFSLVLEKKQECSNTFSHASHDFGFDQIQTSKYMKLKIHK